MAKIPETETDIKDKIYNLYTELKQAKKDKKEAVKAHSDNIKRIEEEMNDLLEQEEEDIKQNQNGVD